LNIIGLSASKDNRSQKLRDLQIGVSFHRFYSLPFHDNLLMGLYPTGRFSSLNGDSLRNLWGWPPVPPDVSSFSRQVQSMTIHAGELLVGVWPWSELWP
jgi:hypothetical protein